MRTLDSIVVASAHYESWLDTQVEVVRADVKAKHEAMAADPFSFLRATYYRWAQVWPLLGKDWAGVTLPGVGDLHIENFGTWRDAEGRLIWGINDFDECGRVTFTSDLARLATSALLAYRLDHLSLSPAKVCEAIWAGYNDGLKARSGPFVLAESNGWLREQATGVLRDPAAFWKKFDPKNARTMKPPAAVAAAMKAALPGDARLLRVVHRQSGLGSLGRPRYAFVAEWKGGQIAREAKAIVTNGLDWSRGAKGDQPSNMARMIGHALRGTDPFNHVHDGWVMRRLSPDCSRIELAQLPKSRDESAMLHAMGVEVASAHLSTPTSIKALEAAVSKLKRKWLSKASDLMLKSTLEDWKVWRKHQKT